MSEELNDRRLRRAMLLKAAMDSAKAEKAPPVFQAVLTGVLLELFDTCDALHKIADVLTAMHDQMESN